MIRFLKSCLAVFCILTLHFASAESVYTASYNGHPLFTIAYDAHRYSLDCTSYSGNSSGYFQWLFLLSNKTYTIDCSCEYLQHWSTLSLQSASEQEKNEYIRFLISEDGYGDYQCEYVRIETVMVKTDRNTQGTLPFILLKLKDPEYGDVYHMETVTNGLAISFEIFRNNGKQMDQNALNELIKALNSITLLL